MPPPPSSITSSNKSTSNPASLPSLPPSGPNSLRSTTNPSGEPSIPPLLAPPPGFSDSEHSHSDNDSFTDVLETTGGFSRYGATRISRQPRQQPAASGGLRNGGVAAVKNGGSFQMRTVLEWSEDDVCDWLTSLEMPEYAAGFKAGDITGSRLTTLDNRDWERLGVTKITHRNDLLLNYFTNLQPINK